MKKEHPITWESLFLFAVIVAISSIVFAGLLFISEDRGWISIQVPITCADGSSTALAYYKDRPAFREGQIAQACGNDLLHNISLSDGKFVCKTDDVNNVKCEQY